MKTVAILILLWISNILYNPVKGQEDNKSNYPDFPIIVTVQFHALALPFSQLSVSFKNIGIGIGTAVSLHKNDQWIQQFNLSWYRNKAVGNGLMFYSQLAWRPNIESNFFGEIKAGAGYLYSFRPVNAYQQINNEWIYKRNKGKGLLALPFGFSLGYKHMNEKLFMATILTHQIIFAHKYNTTLPVVPMTLTQLSYSFKPNNQ